MEWYYVWWPWLCPRSQSRKEMWLTGEKYDWLAPWSRLGSYECPNVVEWSYSRSKWSRVEVALTPIFKVALHRRCPAYLADLVAFNSTDSHRQLRSTTSRAAAIQRTRTQFGRRAFCVCGPDLWNSLPRSVRTVDSNSSFRRALKTHLFQLAFNCFYFLNFILPFLTM